MDVLPHFGQVRNDFAVPTVEVWNDFALPIGLDHRCAPCILQFQCSSPPRVRRQRGLKRWQPTLDSDGLPARFHNILHRNKIRGHHNSLEGFERSLRDAGQQGGNCENTYLRFRPSEGFKNLRAQRRETRDAQLRRSLTFTFRKNHRQEVRVWKIGTCKELANTSEHAICNQGSGSNTPRSQMHLQTCWVKFLQEIQTDRAAQPILQRARGQCMNFNVRWVG